MAKAGKEELMGLARRTRLLLRGLAAALGAAFGWLKFRGVEIPPIAQDLTSSFILQASLILYYFCWIFGATFDTDVQELVYDRSPSERIPASGVVLAVGLAAVFAVLCLVDSYRLFAPFLAGFWVINVGGWWYIVKRILPKILRESRSACLAACLARNDYVQLERFEMVREYMCGWWQMYRFGAGALLIGGINVLAFSPLAGVVAGASGLSPEMIITLSILGQILFVEGWIWLLRLRLSVSLRVVKNLSRLYRLVPDRTD